MAVSDVLDSLHQQVPGVFQLRDLPPGWDDDWIFIPIDQPESLPSEGEDAGDQFGNTLAPVRWPLPPVGTGYPGAPIPRSTDSLYPPPDVFAFYFPFHYFYPDWWGIYVLLEGQLELSAILQKIANGSISAAVADSAARIFLYGHEAFHHSVESFATRLEVTHRRPLYKGPFEALYRRWVGKDGCLEEEVAGAHGFRLVNKGLGRDKKTRETLRRVFVEYFRGCPPGYRQAAEYLDDADFRIARGEIAECNQDEALPDLGSLGSVVWEAFPHAFSGISRVTGRVNYLVHRSSPLALRTGLGLRYLKRRTLIERLRTLGGCAFVREGGEHEIWANRFGQRFPVGNHDLGTPA